LSTSFGISTSTCTSLRRTPSFVCRCTCGYVGPQKSSLPPNGSLRHIKCITSGGRSSKKRVTRPWRKTASSTV
jgi:hypothetical protein